jgi:hypothetical protein
MARYLAVPCTDRNGHSIGWFIYKLPMGSTTPAVARFTGPFAEQRATRRARKLTLRGR